MAAYRITRVIRAITVDGVTGVPAPDRSFRFAIFLPDPIRLLTRRLARFKFIAFAAFRLPGSGPSLPPAIRRTARPLARHGITQFRSIFRPGHHRHNAGRGRARAAQFGAGCRERRVGAGGPGATQAAHGQRGGAFGGPRFAEFGARRQRRRAQPRAAIAAVAAVQALSRARRTPPGTGPQFAGSRAQSRWARAQFGRSVRAGLRRRAPPGSSGFRLLPPGWAAGRSGGLFHPPGRPPLASGTWAPGLPGLTLLRPCFARACHRRGFTHQLWRMAF